MGQVSLPVLSRKGKYDVWNYNWVSFKNYSLNFNEDIFLKKFLFIFFMYGISFNKHFTPIYFKKSKNKKQIFQNKYNLTNYSIENIFNKIILKSNNKYFISKIYLCKYINWMYAYIFIYSITNIRKKTFNKNTKINYINYNTLYQAYLLNRYKYLL